MAKKTKIKIDHHSITRVESGTTRSDAEELKKLRSNLYSQKSYWVKKWNTATKKKDANRAFARAQVVQRELNKVNKKLGVTYELEPVKKEGYFENGVRKKQFNIWEGIKRIREVIKKRYYKTFIIDGHKVQAKYPSNVYFAYDDIERLAYAVPRGTPMVQFEFDTDNKTVTINIF